MTQRSTTPTDGATNGTNVRVSVEAAGKILDSILRKPSAKRGVTSAFIQNLRRRIGQGTCTPGAHVFASLQNNEQVDEFCSALRTLLNPGEVTSEPPREIMLGVNSTLRLMGEHADDLLCGRADSEDYLAITRCSHELAEEFEMLSDAAAHQVYAAPALQRAS